ncbi:MAG: DUF1572 domain-containing protein [Bacteroidota bacterium]|nr:DUF1572 domain-containing protein [Bacteroidota bacterium]
MNVEQHFLENTIGVFRNYKSLADKAFTQLDQNSQFHYQPDPESNSLETLIRHMAGNMISRWTDFLTSDGEKPDRNRDGEFNPALETKAELLKRWEDGWELFFKTLRSLKEEDLQKTVTIRGEGLTVLQALNRQTAHYSYHVGQIVFLAKHIRTKDWISLSIPKNKSAENMKGSYLDTIK